MKKKLFLGTIVTFALTSFSFLINILPTTNCALMARTRRLPDMMK